MLQVILPEGCEDIQVSAPYTVDQARTKRYTYLDSELNGGRPVLILRAKNLVPEHDKEVHISYSFKQQRMVVEPLMLVATFFFLFVVSTVIARSGAAVQKLKKAHSVVDGAAAPTL
jgi:oligosaccharyltransferase complex subunit alpha (ribophorin I)